MDKGEYLHQIQTLHVHATLLPMQVEHARRSVINVSHEQVLGKPLKAQGQDRGSANIALTMIYNAVAVMEQQ